MAGKAPDKQPRKGSNVPPRNINVVNTEQQQIPSSSVGPYLPIRVRGTTSHPPVPYYPSRNVSSPMEQMYRHPHLQPVPDLRLVDLQPPGQRHSQPASVQDGRGLFFYNHPVLTPIPERQTSPFVQPGRAVPVPSAPTNKVDKKAEHQTSVKIRTNVAHRQVDDRGRPTPKTLVAPHDNTKLKYLKKTMKTNSDTLATGEHLSSKVTKLHLSSKVTSYLQLPNDKRKTTLTGGEPLQKISGKLPGLDMPRPKGSTSGSEIVQSTQQYKETSRYNSKHLKGISTHELPAHTTGRIRVQSDAYSEQHLSKRSREEKTKSSNQEPPVKEKITMPLDKKRKRNLDRELSGSHPGDLQTGLNNSEIMKKTSKEQIKDKAKASANPSGTKREKKAKTEAKPVKQIPRSNLALHVTEAVFYPPGKNDVYAVPCKKFPSVTFRTILENTPTILPKPLPRPLPNIGSRQQPTLLPKPPSGSLRTAQSSSLPKPVTSLSKPTPVSGPFWMQATQSSQFSLWRAQPRDANETPVPFRLLARGRRARDTQNLVPPNTPVSGFHPATEQSDRPNQDRCPWRQ